MKNLIYLLFCLLGANDALAQTQILAKAENTLFPFYENGKVGYFYKNTKKVAIKARKFDYGLPFSENLALVREGEMLYFIHKNGKKAFDLPYQFAESFKTGKSIVFDGEKYGLINTRGEILLPFVYDHIFYYKDAKVFAVKQGEKCFFVNEKNERIDTLVYGEIKPLANSTFYSIKKGGKYGVLDKDCAVILPCNNSSISSDGFQDFPLYLSVYTQGNNTILLTPEGKTTSYTDLEKDKNSRFSNYGTKLAWNDKQPFLVTKEGQIFGDSSSFQTLQENGRYYVSHQRKNGKHLWGILAADGSMEIKPQYDSLYLQDEGGGFNTFFIVFQKGKKAYIDMNNIPILPFADYIAQIDIGYNQKRYFELAYKIDTVLQKNIGIANSLGKTIVLPQYPTFITSGSNLKDCYLFKKDKTFALVNRKSKTTLFENYDNLHIVTSGCFIAEKDSLFGVVDYSNTIKIPILYPEICLSPNHKLFFVQDKNKKYGMINENGNIILPCIYEDIAPYYDVFVKIRQAGKWGVCTYGGRKILQCENNEIGSAFCLFSDRFRYYRDRCCVTGKPRGFMSVVYFTKNEKKGALNPSDGSVILPAEYTEISLFPDGKGYAARDSLYGIVNLKGEWLLPMAYKFKQIYHIIQTRPLFHGSKMPPDSQSITWFQNKWGVMDKDLKTIIPFKYDDVNWANSRYEAKKDGKIMFFDEKGIQIE
jgi:hypothetical protein